MARYLAAIQGTAGEATRLGSPKSGIRASAQGWNLGVRVNGAPVYDDANGANQDEFRIAITGGSNDNGSKLYLGSAKEDIGGDWTFEPSSNLLDYLISNNYVEGLRDPSGASID